MSALVSWVHITTTKLMSQETDGCLELGVFMPRCMAQVLDKCSIEQLLKLQCLWHTMLAEGHQSGIKVGNAVVNNLTCPSVCKLMTVYYIQESSQVAGE